MITVSEYMFPASSGELEIHVTEWVPAEIRGVVQIAHGVGEYGKRYDTFARFLCNHGFAVVANDHMGHGASVMPNGPSIYFGEKDGWMNAVNDMERLREITAKKFSEKPYFLFGHSMGSFLSRTHLIRFPGVLDGCILCGTGNPSGLTIAGGKLVANHEIKRLGKKAFSLCADRLVFGAYNKKFEPNRTAVDWLSASTSNVDAYVADPLCGGNTSLGLFRDMLEGLSFVMNKANIAKVDKSLPIFLIAGNEDPVGDMGKGVKKAFHCFQSAGVKDVSMKLYLGLRHELLNEDNAQEIYGDILVWLNQYCRNGDPAYNRQIMSNING